MSGWIKLEKDLLTDPRFLRLAKAVQATNVCNGQALLSVTVVLGALARLWMIADTHVGDDDVLTLGIYEIDEVLGIPGFCELLPENWLLVLDSDSVKLPGFHVHNGSVAKERAQVQKRVARARDKKKRQSVAECNGTPLTDQTRPDQTISKKAPAAPFAAHSIAGLDQVAWARYLAYRSALGKPVKPFSMEATARKLARFSNLQAAVVEQSIAQGWTGLFALKDGPRLAVVPGPSADDRIREYLEKFPQYGTDTIAKLAKCTIAEVLAFIEKRKQSA